MLTYNIVTAFPELFDCFINTSLVKKGITNNVINVNLVDLKEFGIGKYKKMDSPPYGGGPGMVLRVDVVDKAVKSLKNPGTLVALSPKGKTFNQKTAVKLSTEKNITLLCGRYEGFDQRILDMCDMVISIGNYVTMGGEIPAQVIIESTSRLVPGVLGDLESTEQESFSDYSKKEYPIYTKPETYNKKSVPKVLLSGNHKLIKDWKEQHKS